MRPHSFLCFLVAFFLVSPAVCAQAIETGFLNRSFALSGTSYRYQVYIPPGYTPEKQWPVILFLHGAGERGVDGLLQTEVGLGSAIRQHVERVQAIVVFPQSYPDTIWAGSMEDQALKALDRAVSEFHGDPQRLYLTGISMGGFGTWNLAIRYPEKFAAIAPICGWIVFPPGLSKFSFPREAAGLGLTKLPYEDAAKILRKLPIWVFHGAVDPLVPVTESRNMVAALKALKAEVRYSEYPQVAHNVWNNAYSEPDYFDWLLSHRKP
jgi:predicted peptidase